MALKRIIKVLKRPGARMGVLLVLGLWCLGPMAGLLRVLAGGDEHAHSEVEAHRIEGAAAAAPVCHHHPQGCPADCHCPKIVPERPDAEGAGAVTRTLREPFLVQCTEGKAKLQPLPALIAAWLPTTWVALDGMDSRPAWPAHSASPPDPARDPPWHVPRSFSAPA